MLITKLRAHTSAIRIRWSLWKFAVPAVCNAILSLGCYYVGWRLSDKASAMCLARSGAAATIIAIGFTLYDYRSAVDSSEKQARERFKRITTGLPLTGADSQRRIEGTLAANSRSVLGVARVIDAVTLMVATFVWGFGDLATNLM